MSPRPDVSEERTHQILEAAIAMFARLGFRAARMEDSAEQPSLSRAVGVCCWLQRSCGPDRCR
jgi:hypothetical protein